MESGFWGQGADDAAGPGKVAGALAIGCVGSICRNALGDRLVAFTQGWPALDIGVHDMPRSALLPAVRSGGLALAVLPGDPVADLESVVLWQDRVAVAMPHDHPLATDADIDPAALMREHFLISRQEQGAELHRFLARRTGLLAALGGTLCDDSQSRLLERVAGGDGLLLLCASQSGDTPGVAVRSVAGLVGRFAVRAYWRGADPEPALAGLIAALGRDA